MKKRFKAGNLSKGHRVCVAALLLFVHCGLWLVVGEKLDEEVVVREPVDEEEDDVGDGEGAAGEEGAVLPGASCHEESTHVDLRPEGGQQEELDRSNQQLRLVFSSVIEPSPVLHVDCVLGNEFVLSPF